MKNIDEINRAHDIASAVLEKNTDLTEERKDMLLAMRNALCWVLEHEPAKTEMSRWFASAAVAYGVPKGGAVH